VWIVHLTLGLAALYAAVITAMHFAQTWLLFPTALAAAGDVELPAPCTGEALSPTRTFDGTAEFDLSGPLPTSPVRAENSRKWA
jgi:hypothetical protein